MYHLAFIGQYLNAPAGDEGFQNAFLKDVISFIGKKYGTGRGSNFAKGKRYIKSQIPGCTTRHIKLMIRSVPNALVRENIDVNYVFRFSINSYVKIFAFIIGMIIENQASFSTSIANEHEIAQREVLEPNMVYSELLIREPLSSLTTVQFKGTNEKVKKTATVIREGITRADKKYIVK